MKQEHNFYKDNDNELTTRMTSRYSGYCKQCRFRFRKGEVVGWLGKGMGCLCYYCEMGKDSLEKRLPPERQKLLNETLERVKELAILGTMSDSTEQEYKKLLKVLMERFGKIRKVQKLLKRIELPRELG